MPAETMPAEEFKAWRSSMGWTQQECANKINVTRAAVARYESGDRKVSGPLVPLIRLMNVMYKGDMSE